jgi:hypothetical protein
MITDPINPSVILIWSLSEKNDTPVYVINIYNESLIATPIAINNPALNPFSMLVCSKTKKTGPRRNDNKRPKSKPLYNSTIASYFVYNVKKN